jgi:hypothetical protein
MMTAIAITDLDELARGWARRLEDWEAERLNKPVVEARPMLAARIGVSPGTLENIRRDRVKELRPSIIERLRAAYQAEREKQLKLLEHDLEITRALAPGSRAVSAVVAVVDSARGNQADE